MIRRMVLLVVGISLVLTGFVGMTTPRGASAQAGADGKAVVSALYDAYNTGNWDALDAVFAADVVDHNPNPGQAPGVAGVKAALMGFRATLSGSVVIDDVVTEGDLVGDRVHLDGAQIGPFLGVPATGKPVHLVANELWRVRDGKIVEGWHVENLIQVLNQLRAPSTTQVATPAAMAPATASPASSDMAANKNVVRGFYAAVNAGNLAAFDQLVAADAVDHDPAAASQGPGREGIRSEIAALRAAFPDYHVTNQQIIAEGDLVVVHSVAGGTHNGPLAGIPATGRPVSFESIDLWRVANGQIVEVWHVEQLLLVLIEVGVIPAPAGGSATPMAPPMATPNG